MHIGIAVWNLCIQHGGAENSAVQLANEMVRRGHQVTLFFGQPNGESMPCFPVDAKVRLTPFHLKSLVVKKYTAVIHADRELLRNSCIDVFLVMQTNERVMTLVSMIFTTNIPIILTVRNDLNQIWNKLWTKEEYFACMSYADAIQFLTHDYIDEHPEHIKNKITIIPNSLDLPYVEARKTKKNDNRQILLGVGRFSEAQKRFSWLIKAFARLHEYFDSWDLILCGDGPDKESYIRLTKKLNIAHRVTFTGMQDNLDAYYRQADIFCIPSLFEGFPRSLLEASSYGIPSVGFSECTGIKEVIVDNENGILIQQASMIDLATALSTLMSNHSLCESMRGRAIELRNRFSSNTICDLWEIFFKKTIDKKKSLLQNIPYNTDDHHKYSIRLQEILTRDTIFTSYDAHKITEKKEERERVKEKYLNEKKRYDRLTYF